MEQRKKVLLVDAGEEFRTLMREELEKSGEFSVELARDGSEALKKASENRPDLLVMDVMLSGMDGISVLRQLQKQGDAPMTIFISAFISERMLAEISELGAAYFLLKPFEPSILLDKLRGLFLAAPQAAPSSLKTRVTSVIHEIGVPAHIKGYQYLREAIMITVKDMDVINAVTKVYTRRWRSGMPQRPPGWSAPSAMPLKWLGTGAIWKHSRSISDIQSPTPRESRRTASSSP